MQIATVNQKNYLRDAENEEEQADSGGEQVLGRKELWVHPLHFFQTSDQISAGLTT